MNPDSQHALKALVEKWREGRAGKHPFITSSALRALILAAGELEAVLLAQPPAPTREQLVRAMGSAQSERSGDPADNEWSRGYQNAMDNVRRNIAALFADAAPTHQHHPGCAPYVDAPMDGVRNANPGYCLEGFPYDPGPVAAPQERKP